MGFMFCCPYTKKPMKMSDMSKCHRNSQRPLAEIMVTIHCKILPRDKLHIPNEGTHIQHLPSQHQAIIFCKNSIYALRKHLLLDHQQ